MKTKAKRKIVHIDESKCNGCGLCVPACAEGALKIVNGKAKLVSEVYCDGLGACMGECPQGAITIEERAAPEFDEAATAEHLRKQAVSYPEPTLCGCPGSAVRTFAPAGRTASAVRQTSALSQWPVQLALVPPTAPFLKNSNLVIAADCTAYAYANFHPNFLKGKTLPFGNELRANLLIACPKLDDTVYYQEKLREIFKTANIKSVTVVHMEVPCCSGLVYLVKEALGAARKAIPAKEITISLTGEVKSESAIS